MDPYQQYVGLKELPAHRTYNQKVFDNSKKGDKGSLRYRIHARHIHYKDGPHYKDIDTRLGFDSLLKAWTHTKASYLPTIPEYADGWFNFYNAFEETNHHILFRPVCGHIKGTKIPDQHDGLGHESILYSNAFGPKVDLRVNAYWAGLRKIIIIREKPTVVEDLHFDFELQLQPDSEVLDEKDKKWDKQSVLKFKDKTLRIGKNGKYSFFRRAYIWDSEELHQQVDIEFFKQNGKIYLRKTITKEVLEKASFPLYTDHPTNYYTGPGDGRCAVSEFSWNDAHDRATGSAAYTQTTSRVEVAQWAISRSFLPIDTSGIDDDAIISAALLYLYVTVATDGDSDGKDYMGVVQTSQASPTELVSADYNKCGLVDDPPQGATAIDIGNINVPAYNPWTLNEAGRGWIDKEGYTLLGMREGHDIEDDPPDGKNNIYFRTSEYANTGSDPYLDVTVGPAANPYPTARLKKGFISGYHCFVSAYILAKIGGFDPLKLPDGTVF